MTRGLKERKKQKPERDALTLAINEASDKIAELSDKKGSLKLEQDKIEAEVGPIKYVAELIYGENAKDMFDHAVRVVILILIFVFDPLAVLLLIAANISLRQWRRKREIAKTDKQYTLEQRLEREKKKAERFKEKSRDYKKMVAQVADLKDLSPDEVKLKLDQIYDWNDSNIK